jgi:hypothetical protein
MLAPFADRLKKAQLRVTQNVELSAVVLAHAFLAAEGPAGQQALRECGKLIFGLLYETLCISEPNYKAFLRRDLAHGRFVLLGLCLANGRGERSLIVEECVDQLEALVLHDKQQPELARRKAVYFAPFLGAADRETAEGRILPQMEFIMNRTKAFVGVFAALVEGFSAYRVQDLPTLKRWTLGLLPEDLLEEPSGKPAEDVIAYFKSVHAICSDAPDMKRALVMDVLLDRFKQSKRGQAQFKAGAR